MLRHFDCQPTLETFVVSDPHFGHYKIFDKEPDRFLGKSHPKKAFKALRKNWNSAVGKDDTILCLGDMFGDKGERYMHKLNGKKSLILGNHDIKPHNKALLQTSDFAILRGICLQIPNAATIITQAQSYQAALSDYEQECLSVLVSDIGKLRIMFCHYPLFERHPSDERFYRLFELLECLFETSGCDFVVHGHSHSHNARDLRCINASVDVIGYTPIRLKTLMKRAQKGKK